MSSAVRFFIMMRSLCVLVSVFNVIIYALADNCTGPVEPDKCDAGLEQMLQAGNAAFAGKFLYDVLKSKSVQNTIMSAYSVFTPLAQLALYAEGDTKDQLLTALNLPNKSSIRCVFPKIISDMKNEQKVILNVASKIYATDRYPLDKCFVNDTNKIFDAEAESLNFLNREQAAKQINQWVESETNNRIKDIAKPEMFDNATRLVLANAIYFMGKWTNEFDRLETRDRPFYINSDTIVDIPTMTQQDTYKYAEYSDLNCKILEMSYKGENFSFLIFLPNEIDGLLSLVKNLRDPSKFYNAYRSTRYEEVKVYIPKMKIESQYNLIPIMKSVGILDLFNKFRSNLTGILETNEPLYISTAFQKAFITAVESGTEAAAANIFIGARTTSVHIGPVFRFRADHPFCFYIMNKRNIIFSGTFAAKPKD